MSRRHPTHAELEVKSKNIEAERAKTSLFRPKITRKTPSDPFTPGEVERDDRGQIIGEIRPLTRDGQIPFSIIRKAAKYRHDLRGLCSREDCAFKNTKASDEITAMSFGTDTV